jgi:hypothetical protein
MIADWEINSRIRAELIKRRVDMRRVEVMTVGGVVYIKGRLSFRLQVKMKEEDIPDLLKKMEYDLKRLPGVKAIKLLFSNWRKVEDKYEKVY